MKFSIEKYISNFIQSQFPAFYQEEGENFILFLKAYYEWAEQGSPDKHVTKPGGFISESRDLLNYRDIDNTLENFLEFFQRKYLYGIPFDIIANKRFLLKHILDVYRSKGSIQCYRLLFKLIYNEDIEVYLPGRDVLRVSDGIWVEPRYLEVTKSDILPSLVGKTILGTSSGVVAVVEDFVQEAHDNDVINIVYISNISPRGGDFFIGEKIIDINDKGKQDIVSKAPTILGSLVSLDIVDGGDGFNVGDVLKVAFKDIEYGNIISHGVDGILKVTELSKGIGSLKFSIKKPGFGYSLSSNVFIYRNDSTGQGASFKIGGLTNTRVLNYNTDVIGPFVTTAMNATSYGLPANTSANLTSTIGSALSFATDTFGSILYLNKLKPGNSYLQTANIFVRSIIKSNPLSGTVSYNTTSNTVTGTSTSFTSFFANNDVMYIQANSSANSLEYQVIKEVVSDTFITLYGAPTKNSEVSATYGMAPVILPSNFAYTSNVMTTYDGSINGQNEFIRAFPRIGSNTVSKAVAINSGKGYAINEDVSVYLYGSISTIEIANGGKNYTNGEVIYFIGGNIGTPAKASINTNSNGTITNINLTYPGSGYTTVPTLRIQSANGYGAILETKINDLDTFSEIRANIVKGAVGKGIGYWENTQGFLDSDKYIQDDYYYQDYSYEIRVQQTLNTYKNILYNTFHTAGSELFGQYLSIDVANSSFLDLYSSYSVDPSSSIFRYLTSDTIDFTSDNTNVTVDKYYV